MTDKLQLADCINEVCPWSGEKVSAEALIEYRGKVVGFCNPGCRDKFRKAVSLFDPLIDEENGNG